MYSFQSTKRTLLSHDGIAIGFLFAILIASVILMIGCSDISLWSDEAASIKFAHEPIARLWSEWMVRETNPPLYYSVLKFWIWLFGESDFALRSLSILTATAGLVILFMLTREAGGVVPALLATTLLTLSLPHLNFGLQIRCYILAQTLALASLLAVCRFANSIADSSLRRRWLVAYVIATTLALYSHTTLVSLPILVNLVVLPWAYFQWRRDRSLLIEWLIGQGAVLLCWSWWAHITWQQMDGGAANVSWIPKVGLREGWWIVRDAYAPMVPGANLLLMLCMAIAFYALFKIRTLPVLLIGVSGFGLPVLIFFANLFAPIMLPRTIFWGVAPFAAMLAIGLCVLPRRGFGMGGAAILIVLSIAGMCRNLETLQTEPWRQTVEQIKSRDPHATVYTANAPITLVSRYCNLPTCELQLRNQLQSLDDGLPFRRNELAPVAASVAHEGTVYLIVRGRQKFSDQMLPGAKAQIVKIPDDRLGLLTVIRLEKTDLKI